MSQVNDFQVKISLKGAVRRLLIPYNESETTRIVALVSELRKVFSLPEYFRISSVMKGGEMRIIDEEDLCEALECAEKAGKVLRIQVTEYSMSTSGELPPLDSMDYMTADPMSVSQMPLTELKTFEVEEPKRSVEAGVSACEEKTTVAVGGDVPALSFPQQSDTHAQTTPPGVNDAGNQAGVEMVEKASVASLPVNIPVVERLALSRSHSRHSVASGGGVPLEFRSPFEALTMQHVSRVSRMYDDFFTSVIQDCSKKQEKLSTRYLADILGQSNSDVGDSEGDADIDFETVHQIYREDMARVDTQMDRTRKLLLNDLDQYLNALPTPMYLLPQHLRLVVLTAEEPQYFDVLLRSTDSIADLRDLARELMEEKGYADAVKTGARIESRFVIRVAHGRYDDRRHAAGGKNGRRSRSNSASLGDDIANFFVSVGDTFESIFSSKAKKRNSKKGAAAHKKHKGGKRGPPPKPILDEQITIGELAIQPGYELALVRRPRVPPQGEEEKINANAADVELKKKSSPAKGPTAPIEAKAEELNSTLDDVSPCKNRTIDDEKSPVPLSDIAASLLLSKTEGIPSGNDVVEDVADEEEVAPASTPVESSVASLSGPPAGPPDIDVVEEEKETERSDKEESMSRSSTTSTHVPAVSPVSSEECKDDERRSYVRASPVPPFGTTSASSAYSIANSSVSNVQAASYISCVQSRLSSDPKKLSEFINIMKTIPFKEPTDVRSSVCSLFIEEPDLIEGFDSFVGIDSHGEVEDSNMDISGGAAPPNSVFVSAATSPVGALAAVPIEEENSDDDQSHVEVRSSEPRGADVSVQSLNDSWFVQGSPALTAGSDVNNSQLHSFISLDTPSASQTMSEVTAPNEEEEEKKGGDEDQSLKQTLDSGRSTPNSLNAPLARHESAVRRRRNRKLSCGSDGGDAVEVEKVDFYCCKTCALNSICAQCLNTCHKDHNVLALPISMKVVVPVEKNVHDVKRLLAIEKEKQAHAEKMGERDHMAPNSARRHAVCQCPRTGGCSVLRAYRPEEYDQELLQLFAMGFVRDDLNSELLQKYTGSVENVVNSLILNHPENVEGPVSKPIVAPVVEEEKQFPKSEEKVNMEREEEREIDLGQFVPEFIPFSPPSEGEGDVVGSDDFVMLE